MDDGAAANVPQHAAEPTDIIDPIESALTEINDLAE